MNGESMLFLGVMGTVILGMAGAGYYAVKKLNNTSPINQDNVNEEDARNAQEFIPIVDIREGILELSKCRYRAILECGSVNYNLKTDEERDVIELAFQNFISSLSFPITFHIQTRVIDNTLIVRELEKDIEKLKVKNPDLINYAEMYLESIRSFDTYLGDVRQKKKYIIIPYEDAALMKDLDSEEKFEYAIHQMRDRVEFIRDQLSTIGISSKRLNDAGIIEAVYSAYHRDSSNLDMSEFIDGGEYFTPIVMGDDLHNDLTPEKKIDLELIKVQNMIKEKFLSYGSGLNREQSNMIEAIHDEIKRVRESLGAPYGSNIAISRNSRLEESSYYNYDKTRNEHFRNEEVAKHNEEKSRKSEQNVFETSSYLKNEKVEGKQNFGTFESSYEEGTKKENVFGLNEIDFSETNRKEKVDSENKTVFIEENKNEKVNTDFDFVFDEIIEEEKGLDTFKLDFSDFEYQEKDSDAFEFSLDFDMENLVKNEVVFENDIESVEKVNEDILSSKNRLKDLMIFDD